MELEVWNCLNCPLMSQKIERSGRFGFTSEYFCQHPMGKMNKIGIQYNAIDTTPKAIVDECPLENGSITISIGKK